MPPSKATKRKRAPKKQGSRKGPKKDKNDDEEKEIEEEAPTYIGDDAAMKLQAQLKKIKRRKEELDDNEGEEEEFINMKEKLHESAIRDALKAANNLRSTNYSESAQEKASIRETEVLKNMLNKARKVQAGHKEGRFSTDDRAEAIFASRQLSHDLLDPEIALSTTAISDWLPKNTVERKLGKLSLGATRTMIRSMEDLQMHHGKAGEVPDPPDITKPLPDDNEVSSDEEAPNGASQDIKHEVTGERQRIKQEID
ncbi:hypothetical protein KCU78_g7492, partial [Aureobasidium melanogenum]